MIKPLRQDDDFLADVRGSRLDGSKTLRLWWLGQSGFLLQHRGEHLLFDPYLSDSLMKKYATTDKPHVRMTERVIAPERLAFVDVITSTHNHTDHLDAETLIPIVRARTTPPRLVLAAANEAFAADRLKAALPSFVTLNAGESRDVGPFKFSAVPASHEQLTKDEKGRNIYLGFVVKVGPWAIYHSGDTIVFEGMGELLRPFKIDVAVLPINGKVGNMNGVDAARLAKEIGAKLVVPCHYEMFEFNTADPREQFVPECERIGQMYRVLRAAESLTLGGGAA